MAVVYSAWQGYSGHSYRLKVELVRVSSNTSANTSVVRLRGWIESTNGSSFSVSSYHYLRLDGVTYADGSWSFAVAANGSSLAFETTRTVTHSTYGNKTVSATVGFSNAFTSLSVSISLTLPRIPQLPGAPTAAPTATRTGTSVKVTSAAASGHGDTIEAYQIRRRHNHSGSYGSWTSATGRTLTHSISQYASSYSYQYQSRAKTVRGWGPYSATRTITIPAAAPQGTVDGVDVAVAVGKVIASWEKPAGTILSYDVALHDGTAWGSPINVGTLLEHEFTGLTPGTYTPRVRSVLSGGPTAWETGDAIYLGTLPGTVDEVEFDEDGTAIWEPPAVTGGYDLDGYDIAWHDGFDWSEPEESSDPSAQLDGRLPGIGYRCRVRPVNVLGAGDWTVSPYLVDGICPCTV